MNKKVTFVIIFIILIVLLHPGRHAKYYDYILRANILNELEIDTSNRLNLKLCERNFYSHLILNGKEFMPDDIYNLKDYEKPKQGGEFYPNDCEALFKSAIIVPYRNRKKQLKIFLDYMHTFLQLQKIHYRIFIVEQDDDLAFNRAKMLNVGVAEAIKANYSCLILHDVDLFPLVLSNIYSCSKMPRHMSSSVDTFRYNLPYLSLFGGAIAIQSEHFKVINGMSNVFDGWGGEDDDFFKRLEKHNLIPYRFSPDVNDFHSQDYDEEVILGEIEEEPSDVLSLLSTEELEDFSKHFDQLLRQSVGSVLDEVVEKFRLLKSSANDIAQPGWNKLFQYKSIKERLVELTGDSLKEFQEEQYEKISYTDSKKLLKELCLLTTTLSETVLEILRKGTIDILHIVLNALNKESEDLQELENEAMKNNYKLNNLRKDIIKEKKQFRINMENTLEAIHNAKNLYEDTLNYCKHKLLYTDSWENSRKHQHNEELLNKENVYNDSIKTHNTKMEYETRIHSEIVNFLLESTEDLKNDIQYWMQEYDRHTELLDNDILHLKMKWETLTEDHKALAILYEEHQIEMEEWVAYRDEKNRRIAAAIRIQAWWRGTMVRKKLGPFRVKKKKGKKGKKGGKKKKGRK